MPPLKPLTPEERRIMVEALEGEGLTVSKDRPREAVHLSVLKELAKPGKKIKVGVVSDTHLGSKYQQVTFLNAFYEYADRVGVEAYLHGGDVIDGIHKMHRDHIYENFIHGFDGQVRYAAKVYPKSKNGPTFFVDGNHDVSFFNDAGATAGAWLAEVRPDLKYLGYHAAFVDVGAARFFVAHGKKGGGAYALSYHIQKLMEQMDEQERMDCDIALFGHWHREVNFGYQGVECFGLGCFQRQTPYIKNLGLQPTINGLILEMEFGQKGVRWVRPEKMKFKPMRGDYPGYDPAEDRDRA